MAATDLYPLGCAWRDIAGEVNPASPIQLVEFLYNKRKFPLPPITGSLKAVKARRRDEKPTSEASLDWLWRHAKKPENKLLLRTLLDLRKTTKLAQFLEKMPEFVHDGVLYASYGPDTGTGRLASRNPNLQNIPSVDKYGLRSCFVAPPGHKLLVADYAALEPRVLAHYLIKLFGDTTLRDAIETGDLYSAIAMKTWPDKLAGIRVEDIKEHPNPEIKVLRGQAKAILLGTNYGKTVGGLAVQLGLSQDEAQTLYDDYFRAWPGIKAFQTWAYNEFKQGRLRTLLGRTRKFPRGTTDGEKARAARQATNTVIQGSAADIVFAAMLRQDGVPGTLQMQIHDELVWRLDDSADPATLVECMEHPFAGINLEVPLTVSWKLCNNWGEAK